MSSKSLLPSPTLHLLDPAKRNPDSAEFEEYLRNNVIGQGHVINDVLDILQTYVAGLHDPDRPVGVFLLLGPTSTGKTRMAEAIDEALHRRPKADLIKVSMGEFQEEHSVSNLVGSPTGYINHSDKRWITNEDIESKRTPEVPLTVVLLDEIEKAHPAVFKLLLNVFDKGILTTSNQQQVNFRNTLIFMTSNLGVSEIKNLVKQGLGFQDKPVEASHEQREKRAVQSAQKHFAPEFMNRIDKVITFRTLSEEDIKLILDIELRKVQKTITVARGSIRLMLFTTDAAKQQLIKEGYSAEYNARHLKRIVRKHINVPVSNFIGSHQLNFADLIRIDYQDNKFVYHRICANEVGHMPGPDWEAYKAAIF